jgi:hypothetical protein
MRTHIQVTFTDKISDKGRPGKWALVCEPGLNARGDFDGVKGVKNLDKSNCPTCLQRKNWVIEELDPVASLYADVAQLVEASDSNSES